MNSGSPANGSYYTYLYLSGSMTLSDIQKAVVGNYNTLAETAGAMDIKGDLFDSSKMYGANFSGGVIFTVFTNYGVYKVRIKAVDAPDGSNVGSGVVDGVVLPDGSNATDKPTSSNDSKSDVDAIINNSIILKVGNPKALVNGEVKQIDENNANVTPDIDKNGRTLVPVRFIAENSGYKVDYDGQGKKITLSNFGLGPLVTMIIDKAIIEINNEIFEIDAAPKITVDGRTVIPLRAFVEMGLQRKIAYVAAEQIIIISDYDVGKDLAEQVAAKVKDKLAVFSPIWPVKSEKYQVRAIYYYNEKVNGEYKHSTWDGYAVDMYSDNDTTDNRGAAYNYGQDILAVEDGIIMSDMKMDSAKQGSGNANYIKIKHKPLDDGSYYVSGYYHLSPNSQTDKIKPGAEVKKGDKIAVMGNTGNSGGVHLHLEFTKYDKNGKKIADGYKYNPIVFYWQNNNIRNNMQILENTEYRFRPKDGKGNDYYNVFFEENGNRREILDWSKLK